MKISVKRTQPHVYSVSLGGAVHTLGINDLKTLVLEIVRALAPGVLPPASSKSDIDKLADRLIHAKEADLQEFILHASEADILVFLKCTEEDTALHQKLFNNMSDRKHTILSEDLQYSFQDGVSETQRSDTVSHLSELASQHHL